MNGWTMERRQRQAQLIQQWKPWKNSTGPLSSIGKNIVGKNAFKGEVRKQLIEINKSLKEHKKLISNLKNSNQVNFYCKLYSFLNRRYVTKYKVSFFTH